MKKQSKELGKKMSARTRKMNGAFGLEVLEQRRSGLAKMLGILSKGAGGYVSNHPRAVEYTANRFAL